MSKKTDDLQNNTNNNNSLKIHNLANKLAKDAVQGGGIVRLKGYVGSSDSQDKVCLYLNLNFDEYLSIKKSDILHSEEIPEHEQEFGGTSLWVRKDAEIQYVSISSTKLQADVLEGDISKAQIKPSSSAAITPAFSQIAMRLPSGRGPCPTDSGPRCTHSDFAVCKSDPSICNPPPPPPSRFHTCNPSRPKICISDRVLCTPSDIDQCTSDFRPCGTIDILHCPQTEIIRPPPSTFNACPSIDVARCGPSTFTTCPTIPPGCHSSDFAICSPSTLRPCITDVTRCDPPPPSTFNACPSGIRCQPDPIDDLTVQIKELVDQVKAQNTQLKKLTDKSQ